jgi:hypothetical protein
MADISPGANALVVSVGTGRSISKNECGRTFITSGRDRTSLVAMVLPFPVTSEFRVRVGVGSSGRPVSVSSGDKAVLIAFPHRSGLTESPEGPTLVASYDPGAYLDLVWDPGGDNRWRVVGGAGLWTSPLDSNFYNLTDLPSAYRADLSPPSLVSSRWLPVPTFDPMPPNGGGNDQFVVPSTQEMFDLLQPGMPVRWMFTVQTGWFYGIIESFAPVGTPGFDKAVVTFSGVGMASTPSIIEVGPREVLRRITVTIPGVFDDAPSTNLLYDNKQFLHWAEGPAYLVRVSTACCTADSGTPPDVNVLRYHSAGEGTWAAVVSAPGVSTTAPASIGADFASSGAYIDASEYFLDQDTPLEISTTQGGSQDAADLTVEMVFIQDRPIAFWEPDVAGGNPSINLAISGSGGFLDGVWAVVPDSYSTTSGAWSSTTLGTGTAEIMREVWSIATPYIFFFAVGMRSRPSPSASWIYSWMNRMSVSFYSTSSLYVNYTKYSTAGRGSVMNGLMGSTVISVGGNDVAVTWWKVGSRWNSSFV